MRIIIGNNDCGAAVLFQDGEDVLEESSCLLMHVTHHSLTLLFFKQMSARKQLLRDVVLDVVFRREAVTYDPSQFAHLTAGLAEILNKRRSTTREINVFPHDPRLERADEMLVQEIFRDLVIGRILTIGLDASNREFLGFASIQRQKQI
jgi:hypothetical protein